MVITSTVIKYAEAILELATEQDRDDIVGRQLKQIQDAVAGTPQLLRLLNHPTVSEEEKLRVIRTVLGTAAERLIVNFVRLLLQRRQVDILESIATAYEMVMNERAGLVLARVQTAAPLSTAQRERLAAALERLAGRQVKLQVQVVPELIGGARVWLGDRLLDGSLTGRLQRMARAVAGHKTATAG